ncbi:trehalose-phosphatase [Microbacterium sp. ARD32]|uniref:trehalose-phosphatase n=1 Tax=Microbacterium sp. ARD32 TaxID=2962577 RepID=UPI0028826974|nr:trehalose-phosphatase [Microbacterium sp. ARD32]MDT0156985.1 trehalose-phosphatase [Microbacterium sp. ARD32]
MTRVWTPGAPDPQVTAIARTRVLLVALDFDGTASALVADPMSARALPEIADAVQRLALMPDTSVAYVSGRSLTHLREIAEHDDDSKVILAGSHGAQYWFPGEGEAEIVETEQERALRESLFDELEPLLTRYPGVELERKTFGVGIHGRPADPAVERAAFTAVDEVMARRAARWRRRTGDRILEFSSRHEGKDAAITALRARTGATGVLFAGDDVTDEDGLRVLGADDLGVRVGAGDTAAALRVRSPQQIAALLGVIADERAAGRE